MSNGGKKKKKGCRGLWLLIVLLALLVAGGGWYTLGLRAVDPGSTEDVVVEIPNSTGASAIVEILDDAGLRSDSLLYLCQELFYGCIFNRLVYLFRRGMIKHDPILVDEIRIA